MSVLPDAGEAVGAILNGQWKLVRLVGEGGLAAVYEADGQRGQGKRAIKLLHGQFVSNRQIVERFYAEAKACYSLRHPHICGVEAYAYAEDGTPYIVMELLEGTSLEAYIRRKQPMPPEMGSPILFGILQALSTAHAAGIIHRDLKPANIFLVPSAQSSQSGKVQYAAKVLDFGIAKVMDLAGGMGSKTRTGAVLGTPGYMSPEQVKNAKAVDVRTDLWAAGVVFYEMLTCKHPFGSSDQLARMVAVLRDPPMKITEVAPHLSHWEAFFERALSRDVATRFQTAEEMAGALRAMSQAAPAPASQGLQTVALPLMPEMSPQAHAMHSPSTQASPAQARTSTMPQMDRAPVPPQPPVHPVLPPPPKQAPPQSLVAEPHAYRAPPQAPNTQISAEKPSGTPTYHSEAPRVDVLMAREEEPASLVWWGVMLVAVSAFAVGVLVGYLLAY